MKKRIISFFMTIVISVGLFAATPKRAEASTTYMTEEMASVFVEIAYKAGKITTDAAADEVRAVLKGEQKGTEDQIKSICDTAAMLYGIVNRETLIKEMTSNVTHNYTTNIGYVLNFASGAVNVFKGIKSFSESDSKMRKTLEGIKVGVNAIKALGGAAYISPQLTLAISVIDLGLSVGGVLEQAVFAEGLEMYKAELEIEYHTGQELTHRTAPTVTGLGLSQEEADAQYSAVYMDFFLKRIADSLSISIPEEKTTYTLTLNSNMYDIATTSTTYEENTVLTLPELSNSTYVFKGWYYDSNLSNKVSGNSVTMTDNLTLYAKWLEQYSYTILDDNSISITKFNGCTKINGVKITDIVIPSTIDGYNVTEIGHRAFAARYDNDNGDLTSITVPYGVTFIGMGAFHSCKSAIKIEIPNSVECIKASAFSGCRNMENFPITANMTKIEDYTYANCQSISNIEIPNSIISIGYAAFLRCNNTTNIYLSENISEIGNNVFNVCSKLSNIIVDEKNTHYSSLNGNLFNKDKTKLIRYAPGKNEKKYEVPHSVKYIDDAAFHWSNLEKVIIPDGVTIISKAAFNHCPNLKEIVIPNTVLEIGDLAFHNGTSSLANIYYSGTSNEWQSIAIGEDNSPLSTAKITYNCKYITDTTMIIDDGKTTNISINPEEKYINCCTVIIALYKDNKLVGIKPEKFTGNTINFSHNSEHDTIKIMYWNSINNLKPLTQNQTISTVNW